MKIIIRGNPVAQARPRFVRRGKFVSVYDPQKSLKKEILSGLKGLKIIAPPIKCIITFYMPIPKSLSKKKKAELPGKYHIKKPDLDNFCKLPLDILEKHCYDNDSHISYIIAKKVYSDEPRTEIIFETMNEISTK